MQTIVKRNLAELKKMVKGGENVREENEQELKLEGVGNGNGNGNVNVVEEVKEETKKVNTDLVKKPNHVVIKSPTANGKPDFTKYLLDFKETFKKQVVQSNMLIAPFNSKISLPYFERLKIPFGQKIYTSVLFPTPIIAELHWDDELKSFYCLGEPICCENFNKIIKIVYIIVVYDFNKVGELASNEVELKLLYLSPSENEILFQGIETEEEMLKCVIVSQLKSANDAYQNATHMIRQGMVAPIIRDSSIFENAMKIYDFKKNQLKNSIAKTITSSEIEKYLISAGRIPGSTITTSLPIE